MASGPMASGPITTTSNHKECDEEYGNADHGRRSDHDAGDCAGAEPLALAAAGRA